MRKLVSSRVYGSIRIIRSHQGWPYPLKKVLISIIILSALLSSTQLQATQSGKIIGWGVGNMHGDDFVAISAGGWHDLALKQDGSIIGWGDNWWGEANPPDGNDFVAIAAGGEHSLALKQDGSIIGWGSSERFAESEASLAKKDIGHYQHGAGFILIRFYDTELMRRR